MTELDKLRPCCICIPLPLWFRSGCLFFPPFPPFLIVSRHFVYQLRRISSDAGMPVVKDPFCQRYVQGLDNVEPLFRQLRVERPDLQLIMVILPGKTPVYGEHALVHSQSARFIGVSVVWVISCCLVWL